MTIFQFPGTFKERLTQQRWMQHFQLVWYYFWFFFRHCLLVISSLYATEYRLYLQFSWLLRSTRIMQLVILPTIRIFILKFSYAYLYIYWVGWPMTVLCFLCTSINGCFSLDYTTKKCCWWYWALVNIIRLLVYGWTFCVSSNDAAMQTISGTDHTYTPFHLLKKGKSNPIIDIVMAEIWYI